MAVRQEIKIIEVGGITVIAHAETSFYSLVMLIWHVPANPFELSLYIRSFAYV